MRIVLYVLIIALSFLAPVKRLDVAKLEPVEAIAVSVREDLVVLETDAESVGKGATVQEALQNLKDNTPAVIYLDTAKYLLAGEGTESCIPELKTHLKPSVKEGKYNGGKVKEEAKYLDAHDESAKPEVGF